MTRAEVRLRGGPPVHPWVYSKRVLRAEGGARDGDVVRLVTREGRPCGFGFWHSRSLVAVRVLSHDPEREPDEAWLRDRVREASRVRTDLLRLQETTDAWRVVHAESDGLSGLIVDLYASVAVVGLFSLGWQRRLDEVSRIVREVTGATRVVARADDRTCAMEGFRAPSSAGAGAVEIRERGVRYVVDLEGGHKTGFFLDQRDNRALVARLAKGRRVFDGMTYTGGFALAAATGGAAHVVGVDLDETALEVAERNAKLNGCSNVEFRHGDVFDALRALAGGPPEGRPDLLIVDPAKWAKDRAGLRAAIAKYGDLNRLALTAVADGGVVLTCSCSGLVSQDEFLGVLKAAALDLRRDLRFLHVGGAAPDHPVSSSFPEGRYLKAVLVAPGRIGEGPGRSERPGSDSSADDARDDFRGDPRDSASDAARVNRE